MNRALRWTTAALAAVATAGTAPAVAQEAPPPDEPSYRERPPAQGRDRERPPERQRPSKQPAPGERRMPEDRRAEAIDEVKRRCLAQIDRRHQALAMAKRRVAEARHLTDDHEAALIRNIENTAASLSRLADAVQAEDDFDELKAHCRSIVEDHRVFVLVLPRARLVVAADTAGAAASRLRELGDRFEPEVAEAEAEGHDMSQARSDLAALRDHVAVASERAGRVPDATLGITPAQYNANHQVLDGPRSDIRTARDNLRAALAAAKRVRAELETSRRSDRN